MPWYIKLDELLDTLAAQALAAQLLAYGFVQITEVSMDVGLIALFTVPLDPGEARGGQITDIKKFLVEICIGEQDAFAGADVVRCLKLLSMSCKFDYGFTVSIEFYVVFMGAFGVSVFQCHDGCR